MKNHTLTLLAGLALLLAAAPSVAHADGDRWGRPGGLDSSSPFRDTCRYDQNCGAKRVSDAVLAGSFAAGLGITAGLALDRLPYADETLSPDPILVGEPLIGWSMATLPTLLTWQITRAVERRPRPFTYDEAYLKDYEDGLIAPRSRRNHTSSFFSGHTSLTAANLFAVSTLVAIEPDLRPYSVPLYVGALAGTVIVGAARVQAGYHYLSDVTVGAVVGAGFGIIGPIIAHQLQLRVQAARGKRLPVAGQAANEVQVVLPLAFGTF